MKISRLVFFLGILGLGLGSLTNHSLHGASPAKPAETAVSGADNANGANSANHSGGSILKQLDAGFTQIYAKVAPSVVVIHARSKRSDNFDTDDNDTGVPNFFFRSPQHAPRVHSEGSGFIIRSDGYILTNDHVVAQADQVTVQLKDGRRFAAKIVGRDDKTDIAVLKIDADHLPAVQFANSDALRIGQVACAIGAPYDLDYTFTCGIVSAKDRNRLNPVSSQPETIYQDYIQTDAAISPGNSGGPLLDSDGRVIGMNTLVSGLGNGLGFAIPSNMLQSVSAQIIAHGHAIYPWIGIQMQTLQDSPDLRSAIKGVDKGAIVAAIEADSPAFHSDLRPADVITAVDGKPTDTSLQLQQAILKKQPGEKITLTVFRDGKTLQLPVTLGTLPSDLSQLAVSSSVQQPQPRPAPSNQPPSPSDVKNRDTLFGLKFVEGAKNADGSPLAGAKIAAVAPSSAAAIAGLQPDDIITEIDSKAIKNADAATALLRESVSESKVLLFVERGGQRTYAVLKRN